MKFIGFGLLTIIPLQLLPCLGMFHQRLGDREKSGLGVITGVKNLYQSMVGGEEHPEEWYVGLGRNELSHYLTLPRATQFLGLSESQFHHLHFHRNRTMAKGWVSRTVRPGQEEEYQELDRYLWVEKFEMLSFTEKSDYQRKVPKGTVVPKVRPIQQETHVRLDKLNQFNLSDISVNPCLFKPIPLKNQMTIEDNHYLHHWAYRLYLRIDAREYFTDLVRTFQFPLVLPDGTCSGIMGLHPF